MKKVIIIGSGMGGLATALRLSTLGYEVTVLEKFHQPGGRLNIIEEKGFLFDQGPSFMSMSYEFKELFDSCGLPYLFKQEPLEPVYQVFFEGKKRSYRVSKDLGKLQEEFKEFEPDIALKVERYLKRAKAFFDDTEKEAVKSNFDNIFDYLIKLAKVPKKHLPYLFKSLWKQVEEDFSSEELRMIFSLCAFFLGTTPFDTPAIYSLLSYVELRHDSYWSIEGGMYKIVEEIMKALKSRGVDSHFNTEVVEVLSRDNKAYSVKDQNGKIWESDIFVCNADAASFRGQVLKRPEYSEEKLDKMQWGMAPFTIYLGVKGKIPNLLHHNYFLGKNFTQYAQTIFSMTSSPEKPYYYVNASSKTWAGCAPENCENLFILCPMPDLRTKKDWSDKEALANNIIDDFAKRVGFDVQSNTIVKKILTPLDWQNMFNLYKGSGLSLCHGLNQIGIFRPKNKDEKLKNFYYVGASTIPGTGLPMVIIGSKLVLERIQKDERALS
ncbi:MAG TPA: phytoene desaturase family protein [Candidatus Omnitrophota bacterium]|nr:phytoene desaturase family protein [Candidatus Omnitrophota bacterium]HPN89019.1 phytoene desaturase family protein [Candidatus Omnitrophota bacterium]